MAKRISRRDVQSMDDFSVLQDFDRDFLFRCIQHDEPTLIVAPKLEVAFGDPSPVGRIGETIDSLLKQIGTSASCFRRIKRCAST